MLRCHALGGCLRDRRLRGIPGARTDTGRLAAVHAKPLTSARGADLGRIDASFQKWTAATAGSSPLPRRNRPRDDHSQWAPAGRAARRVRRTVEACRRSADGDRGRRGARERPGEFSGGSPSHPDLRLCHRRPARLDCALVASLGDIASQTDPLTVDAVIRGRTGGRPGPWVRRGDRKVREPPNRPRFRRGSTGGSSPTSRPKPSVPSPRWASGNARSPTAPDAYRPSQETTATADQVSAGPQQLGAAARDSTPLVSRFRATPAT